MTAATPLQCPACQTPLEPFSTEARVDIDLCPSCRRAWFDQGELGRVLNRASDLDATIESDIPLLGHAPLLCPACRNIEMNRVPFRAGESLSVDRCPYCGGVFCELASLAAMRAPAAPPPRREAPKDLSFLRPDPVIDWRYDPDRPVVHADPRKRVLITVPTAFVAASIWRIIPLSMLVPGGARTPLHELGHAGASWLTSVPAIPIPIGLTIHAGSRSVIVFLVFTALLLFGAARAYLRKAWGAFATCATLLLACTALTWGLDEHAREAWFLWCGGAGEMFLPMLMVAFFHVRGPERLRWDLARWIALPMGSFLLLDRVLFWMQCARDPDLIPWGAAFSSDEQDGDLSRLVAHHGWTESLILSRYIHFGWACLAVVLVAWAIALARAPRDAPADTV